ncbi:MAG: hypothetical protein AUK44_01695 [Porphyromonadaceae bacterium CG2_30_38_12]|nr:MAG: hypothetical protein AUK44_01695 [Porphyromonadaceae bacterium CG2_30_38_12]
MAAWATEYTVQTIPNPKTTDAAAFVSNPDGILAAQTVDQINQRLHALKSENGSEVAVVVVNSIGTEEIKPFATSLFKTWGIGNAQNSNGLLVFFVMDQKKVTFETGYGLEGVLPDAICKRIQSQDMIPEFKEGNFDAGMLAGVERIVSVVRGEKFAPIVQKPIPWDEIVPLAVGVYIVIALLALFWISSILSKIKNDTRYNSNMARYKAIKTEKASALMVLALVLPILALVALLVLKMPAYLIVLVIPIPLATLPAHLWGKIRMLQVRRAPMPCTVCDGTMHLLSEKQEDAHLKLAQQFEEELHAVDYDVFVCDTCKNESIYTLDKPSKYSNCPKCGTKAFIMKDKRTIVAPTYLSAGTERTTFHCKFCGYEENHNDNIPRLQRNSSAFIGGAAAGSILSSGRGGFGGGGFSGGSFGGGFSGGGGATSGW